MVVILYRDGAEVCRDESQDQDVVGDILWDMLQHRFGLNYRATLAAIQAGSIIDNTYSHWTWEVRDA